MPSDNEDAWDDIFLNPHESHVELGRQDGREAGLHAGFKDGYALGRTKGIEFGMELGFIRGFLNTIENGDLESGQDAARVERIQKGVEDLRRAIDDFPSPDAVLTSRMNSKHSLGDDSEANATDIMGALQRIRAKFKVLTVQLKMPHYSLKQVLADAARDEIEEEEYTSHVGGVSNASGRGGKALNESQGESSSEW
jgi:hypothetical protein